MATQIDPPIQDIGRRAASPLVKRYGHIVIAAAFAVGVPLAASPIGSASAATRIPVVTVSPSAVVLGAGQVGAFAVRSSSNLPSNVRWTIRGLPQGVEGKATLPCASPRACVVALRANPSAPESTSLITIVLSVGPSVRSVSVALHVDPATSQTVGQ